MKNNINESNSDKYKNILNEWPELQTIKEQNKERRLQESQEGVPQDPGVDGLDIVDEIDAEPSVTNTFDSYVKNAEKSVVFATKKASYAALEPCDSNPSRYISGLAPKKRTSTKVKWEAEKIFTPEPPQIEMNEAITPSDNEDFDNVRDSIKIMRGEEKTLVFGVAVNVSSPESNVVSAIRCMGGTALGGYAYDTAKDSYLVNCIDIIQLGQVPFSFVITVENVGTWMAKIPMPDKVLKKHLSPQQRRAVDAFKSKYPSPQYAIHFVQMLGCN